MNTRLETVSLTVFDDEGRMIERKDLYFPGSPRAGSREELKAGMWDLLERMTRGVLLDDVKRDVEAFIYSRTVWA